jgi:predicted ATPase
MVGDYLHSLGRPWVPSRALVGRESEFATLKAALDETVSGRGSLVLIGGEPGIGKTRLAEELSAHAKSLGVRALWANCWEKGGAPAFWPWIQVLRELLREHIGGINQSGSEAELHAAGVADLARLLPELAERFNDRPRELREAPTLPPDQARFRLFDSIARLLVTMSSIQPLLLVLDDLQWADLSSLMLLKFLARELHGARLLVVCAYRDVEVGALHPLAEFFGDLAGLCHHLTLRGLSPEEVAQLIALMTGISASVELVASVHEQTGGNSFFVREMAASLLSSQGRLGPVDKRGAGRTGVRESVRQVLQRRLDQLSTGCGEQLVVGAILGQEFRLDVLQVVTGRSLRTELELLDEAVVARLVEEMPGTPVRYRFDHVVDSVLGPEMKSTGEVSGNRQQLRPRIRQGAARVRNRATDLRSHLHLYGAQAPAPGHPLTEDAPGHRVRDRRGRSDSQAAGEERDRGIRRPRATTQPGSRVGSATARSAWSSVCPRAASTAASTAWFPPQHHNTEFLT